VITKREKRDCDAILGRIILGRVEKGAHGGNKENKLNRVCEQKPVSLV